MMTDRLALSSPVEFHLSPRIVAFLTQTCSMTMVIATLVGCDPGGSQVGIPENAPAVSEAAGVVSETPAGVDAEGNPNEPDGSSDGKPDMLYSPEAFRLAAHDGKLRVVEVCLDSGLEVNEADPNGLTPLAMAAYNGHDAVVKLLIQRGAKVDVPDRTGKTPLIHAASGPAPTTVQILIDAGASVNAVDFEEKWTALMMAAAEGQAEVVEVLLAAGADKDMVDIDGESAAYFARQKGHLEIAERLEAK